MDTLTIPLAPGAPQSLPALATTRKLLAWRVITVTLDGTIPPRPAWTTVTPSCVLVTHRVETAVAVVCTLRAPEAILASACACVLVTLALLAEAGLLAVGTPAVGVACALARHVVTVAVGEALALALAVRAPELGWALWGRRIETFLDDHRNFTSQGI